MSPLDPLTVLKLLIFSSACVCMCLCQGSAGRSSGPPACPRVHGQKFAEGAAKKDKGHYARKFSEPTIITLVLEGLFPAVGHTWQESSLKKQFAKETVTCADLGGASCLNGDGQQIINDAPVELTKIIARLQENGPQADLHGNLFIQKQQIAKRLVRTVVNDSSDTPALTKALELVREPHTVALSLGRKGNWNPLHWHQENVFVQMTGRKGFVMIERKKLPKNFVSTAARGLDPDKVKGVFDHVSMCRHVMTCETWVDTFGGPEDPELCQREAIENPHGHNIVTDNGGFTCELREGEALYIPAGWWHGTCNLDTWNAGFTLINQLSRESARRDELKKDEL